MQAAQIRQKFLDYFKRHNHTIVRSASIVPQNDPTLYFTNAGMVPFKDVFVGKERRDYTRACSAQKCLRVSGKHNDLESVGRTSRHHTFFEMLGNFSFGDYFKADAVKFAWEFLTKEIGLAPQRMVVTIFAGDAQVPADEDAAQQWQTQVGIPADRIIRLGRDDNFWQMGDVGPCGPCTEIHYLQGPDLPCAEKVCRGVACECDRWVEIWNLVFMQFERFADGTMKPLAKTGVDTGMGLERLAAVSQGVLSNYDTDLLRPLIELAASLCGRHYGDKADADVSLRVLADHARATVFCIADGVFPEKGGREYVLRRIMRRAIRHGHLLGFDELFFHQLCDAVVTQMGSAYPELLEHREVIQKMVQAEESAFRRTLTRGLSKLQSQLQEVKTSQGTTLSDAFVGDLYATDGFPIDLTRLIAEEQGISVDEKGAQTWVMTTHGAGETKVGDEAIAAIYKELADAHGATKFVGYDQVSAESKIIALLVDGKHAEQVSAGQSVEVVVAQTPFYGRAGGQVGDIGTIATASNVITVRDTLKPAGGLIVHQGVVQAGKLSVGDTVTLHIDDMRRQALRLNHSATHLLHHALRQVLGGHVAQKGSLVTPDYLRFDFSHFEPMTTQQIAEVERLVNAEIRANGVTRTEELSFEDARKTGAMALFGEKYGDVVRVVHIGHKSLELCGGTHVRACGEIGLFHIVSEEALAMGVRRIAAVTGEAALTHIQAQQHLFDQVAQQLKVAASDVPSRVERVLAQLKHQEREIADLKKKLLTGGKAESAEQVREVGGVRVLSVRVDDADPKTMREVGDTLRDRVGSGLVVLGGVYENRATIMVMVTADLTSKLNAGKLVGQLAKFVDGKGGGRADMAQAGGPNVQGLTTALEQVDAHVCALVG